MNTYVVVTQMIDAGEVLPVGAIVREDRFRAERLALQLSLGLIAPAPQPETDLPPGSAPGRTRKVPDGPKE